MTVREISPARILTRRDGTFAFDKAGEVAAIGKVYDRDGVLVDFVAWFIDHPGTWWLRRGTETPVLGVHRSPTVTGSSRRKSRGVLCNCSRGVSAPSIPRWFDCSAKLLCGMHANVGWSEVGHCSQPSCLISRRRKGARVGLRAAAELIGTRSTHSDNSEAIR